MSDIFGGEGAEFEVEARQEPVHEPEPRVEAEPIQEEVVEREEPKVVNESATVPLAALNESRAQLRQTQAELNQMRAQMEGLAKLREEIEEYRNRQKAQQEEQQFNQDPLGMLQRQLKELNDRVSNQNRETLTQAERQTQEQQLFSTIATQVNEFKKATPDYDDALQHVLDARRQELMTMGASEMEAQQRVAMEAQDIAMNALRAGQNPGQVVYQLAKLRGYGAKQAAQKLTTVAKGQEVSRSLSNSSGSTDRGDISLAEVDNMSEDEFDKWWKKFERDQKGGRANH